MMRPLSTNNISQPRDLNGVGYEGCTKYLNMLLGLEGLSYRKRLGTVSIFTWNIGGRRITF